LRLDQARSDRRLVYAPPCRKLPLRRLHALCIASNPCRPYETHVYVAFGQSEIEIDSKCDGSLKGGHFGLSLGRLLSKGGMMNPVSRVSRTLVVSGPGQAVPATARSES
jgi:hypothetical protein